MNNCDIYAAERRLKERNAVARQYLNRFNNDYSSNQPNFSREKAVPKIPTTNIPPKPEKSCESSFTEQAKEPQTTYQNKNAKSNTNYAGCNSNNSGIFGEIFGGSNFSNLLNLDNDKLIIIAVVFVLAKEKADIKLILALLYLIL